MIAIDGNASVNESTSSQPSPWKGEGERAPHPDPLLGKEKEKEHLTPPSPWKGEVERASLADTTEMTGCWTTSPFPQNDPRYFKLPVDHNDCAQMAVCVADRSPIVVVPPQK